MDHIKRLETSIFYFLLEIQRTLCAVGNTMNIWTLVKFHSEDFYWRFKAKFDPAESQIWYSFGIFIPIFQGVRVLWAQSFCLMGRSCPLIPCRDVTRVLLAVPKKGHIDPNPGSWRNLWQCFPESLSETTLWKRVSLKSPFVQSHEQPGVTSAAGNSVTHPSVCLSHCVQGSALGRAENPGSEPGDKMLVNKG